MSWRVLRPGWRTRGGIPVDVEVAGSDDAILAAAVAHS
jgi:hypothetical protein